MQLVLEYTRYWLNEVRGQRRYFDEDFEAAAMRCFKCGGQGHMARDCPNEERQRPCHLCGQFGHTRYQCSNSARLDCFSNLSLDICSVGKQAILWYHVITDNGQSGFLHPSPVISLRANLGSLLFCNWPKFLQ